MIDFKFDVAEQMSRSRYVNGRHERLENGQWVPWPVLTLDKRTVARVARGEWREERRER